MLACACVKSCLCVYARVCVHAGVSEIMFVWSGLCCVCVCVWLLVFVCV